jgi:hypothetical protein
MRLGFDALRQSGIHTTSWLKTFVTVVDFELDQILARARVRKTTDPD